MFGQYCVTSPDYNKNSTQAYNSTGISTVSRILSEAKSTFKISGNILQFSYPGKNLKRKK
jgi:hypothetical protein